MHLFKGATEKFEIIMTINMASILMAIYPECDLVEITYKVRKYTYIYFKKREAKAIFIRNLY